MPPRPVAMTCSQGSAAGVRRRGALRVEAQIRGLRCLLRQPAGTHCAAAAACARRCCTAARRSPATRPRGCWWPASLQNRPVRRARTLKSGHAAPRGAAGAPEAPPEPETALERCKVVVHPVQFLVLASLTRSSACCRSHRVVAAAVYAGARSARSDGGDGGPRDRSARRRSRTRGAGGAAGSEAADGGERAAARHERPRPGGEGAY